MIVLWPMRESWANVGLEIFKRGSVVSTFIRRAILAMGIILFASRPGVADIVHDNLLKMADQYRLPRTVHATMDTFLEPKKTSFMGPTRRGTYECWVDGEKYRLAQLTVPPNSNFDNELRWDGERIQELGVDSSTLLISKNARRNTPSMSLLPLLRPFQFLFTDGGINRAVMLTWADASSEQTRARFAAARKIPSKKAGVLEAVYPGGKDYRGIDYVYHIEFGGTPAFMPSKIREVSSAGVDLLTAEITYRPIQCAAGQAYLPHSIHLTVRDPDNSELYVQTVTVTSIEVDKPIPPETFTVDFQTVRSVIDLDYVPTLPGHGSATKDASAPEGPAAAPPLRQW